MEEIPVSKIVIQGLLIQAKLDMNRLIAKRDVLYKSLGQSMKVKYLDAEIKVLEIFISDNIMRAE